MLRRITPLKRSTKPIPKRRKKPRRGPLRDKGYLQFLRSCSCLVCHDLRFQCDPAHGPVNGRGSKGPDNEAIPLCRYHHVEQHEIGWMMFLRRYQFNWMLEASIYYRTYKGGGH